MSNIGKAPDRRNPIITFILLALAILMLLIGYKNGEHRNYFQKAIMVCTQCIGLG